MSIYWRTFVVSLRRVRNRRLEAIRQIQAAGVEFEIVDAVDAAAYRHDFLRTMPDGWKMSPGEVACYHSHIGILERICDYGLDFGVILEDDFRWNSSTNLNFGNLFELLPKDADHVQLHNLGNDIFKGYKVRYSGEHFNRLDCTNVCTFGFLISRRLAQFVLENFRTPGLPIDHRYIEISRDFPQFGFYDLNERLIDCRWDLASEIIR